MAYSTKCGTAIFEIQTKGYMYSPLPPPPPQEGLNTVPLTLQQEDCNLMLTLLLSNTLGYTEFWKQWSPGLSLGIQVCR